MKQYSTAKLRLIKFLDNNEYRIPFLSFLYLLKNHKTLQDFFDVRKDYLNLKNNFSFLRAKHGEIKGKKILIVSLSSFIYQVKVEAMIALALQLAGNEVYILTRKHFFWPRRYFRLFGINKFVYFEDYFSRTNEDAARDYAQGFLKEKIGFQEVKKWNFRGCRLGQEVLSTIARRLFGTPDLLTPQIFDLFKHFLKKQIRAIFSAERILDDIAPDILIFNEANDSVYGAIFDIAFNKGLNCIQFVQPLRDDALIFKRFDAESKGLHPNSLSKSTFEKIRNFDWSDCHEHALWEEFESRYAGKWFLANRNQTGKVKKDRVEIIQQLKLDQSKKNAVVFSHVLWDANLFYGEDIFEDYEEWFVETIKAACANQNVNWLIKLHPSNVWKRNREGIKGELREDVLIKEKIGQLPGHIFLLRPETDINTFSLFNLADYGVTVRGTVGMELPCFGKPVFTAGTGRYSGLGFTVDSSSRGEYLEKLSKIDDFPELSVEETLLAKKHAYAVFVLRPWRMNSFKAGFNYKKRGSHPLDHNLYPAVSSYEELMKAKDLNIIKDWLLNDRTPDYLEDWNKCAV